MTNDKASKVAAIIEKYFDASWYVSQFDNGLAGLNPLDHYINEGWRNNKDPNKFFSVKLYRQIFLENDRISTEPLSHAVITDRYENFVKENGSRIKREILASYFDHDFYRIQTGITDPSVDLLNHYINSGWKTGLDPNPIFSTSIYLKKYHKSVGDSDPFYHWLTLGKANGQESNLSIFPAKELTEAEIAVIPFFDNIYYLERYPDVKGLKWNPLVHYMRKGWLEGRNPNANFKTNDYILNHLDLLNTGRNPFYDYIVRYDGLPIAFDEVKTVKKYLGSKIFSAYQDISFPVRFENAEKLIVFILPEHSEMSGGIFSIFSIMNIAKRLKFYHGYESILMTRPNKFDTTYCRQHNFINSEDVYRFDQIIRMQNLKEIFINIPEYTARSFVESISLEVKQFLLKIPSRRVNILNQNIDLMPAPSDLQDLREFANLALTQSVAHHAYATQEVANKYSLPTLLLPAYTDLSGYSPSAFKDKSNLIIYSKDDAPHKKACLEKLKNEFKDFKFIEINNITFDTYMELATNCKFSISFGEGFDGYIAQPIFQGGLGLTVFKDEFFPNRSFLKYDVFFETGEKMVENITNVMCRYLNSEKDYCELNKKLVSEYDKLYNFKDYVQCIKKLIRGEIDFIPGELPSSNITKNFRIGLASHSL
jgi:hypothetical protein